MHDKNPNVDTLNMIYQSSKMGVDSISSILPKVENNEMKKELAFQMLGYHDFIKNSSQMLHEIHHYPHDINLTAKIPAYVSLRLKTTVDNSQSHIAEMMIEGSTMGVIEMQKKLNENKNLTENVTRIASDIIAFEETNITKLKGYL